MSLDPEYLDAIKGFEGYSPSASWDYKQNSSGYGTKAQPGDENIPPDQLKGVHEQRFQTEIGNAAASVDSFNPALPPGVRAALTSLTYNAGPGWQQSGLGAAVKAGDFDKAKDIFLQYNKAGGEVNDGLTARRQKEAAWFNGQPAPSQQTASASPASPAKGPLQITPQQAPILPGSQGVAPHPSFPQAAPASSGGGYVAQVPAEALQAPPIHFAQRRQIDLTALRNAIASRAPYFPKG